MSEFGRLGPSNFAGERPVLSENHIRTYWWCSPARIGMATMAPDRWTARCKGASFSASEACEAYDPTVRGRAGRLEHRDEQGKDLSFPCASPSPKLHRSTVRPTTQLEEADGRDPADRLERYFRPVPHPARQGRTPVSRRFIRGRPRCCLLSSAKRLTLIHQDASRLAGRCCSRGCGARAVHNRRAAATRCRRADLRERPGRADTRPPHIGSRTSSIRSRQSCDVLWRPLILLARLSSVAPAP